MKKINRILTVEEIRDIQKEEIHKLITKYIYGAFWVAAWVAMNFIAFNLIAAAHNDNLTELKVLAGVLNYMTQIGFYHGIKLTFEDEK